MRIAFFIVMVLGMCFSFQPTEAAYNDAQHFVEKISGDALTIIESSTLSDEEKYDRLNTLFMNSVDTDWMAKFALSNYWQTFDQSEKNLYLGLYRDFLMYSYVPKFKSYTNQKLSIKKYTLDDKETMAYTVHTEIISPNTNKAIRVHYRVHKNNAGEYRIYDIIGEGVSLITTQRSDFSSLVAREGTDYFLDLLKKRIARLKP